MNQIETMTPESLYNEHKQSSEELERSSEDLGEATRVFFDAEAKLATARKARNANDEEFLFGRSTLWTHELKVSDHREAERKADRAREAKSRAEARKRDAKVSYENKLQVAKDEYERNKDSYHQEALGEA